MLAQLNSSRSPLSLAAALQQHLPVVALGALQYQQRQYATAAEDAAARAARPGQRPPQLLPFTVTSQQALAAFKQYQRDHCFNLHASNLLSSEHKLLPVFMPFWLFEATITTEATAALGRKADPAAGSKSPLVWAKMQEWRTISTQLTVPHTDHCMQVYAAYNLRRDLSEAAKPASLHAAAATALSHQDLQRQSFPDSLAATLSSTFSTISSSSESTSSTKGSSTSSSSTGSTGSTGSSNTRSSSSSNSSSRGVGAGHVPLELPLMRQAIAWQLCHRQLMHHQLSQAAAVLKRELQADDVRDLQVRMHVHSRSARMAYFPAYHLQYVHGEKYTPSRADIVPARYDALIGATDKRPRVCAELHPSPIKSQAAAAAAVAGVGLGVMPLTSLALGIDPGFIGFGGADAALVAVLAATGAGALASQLPLIARNRHAAAQAAADRDFYKQYDQRESAYGAPPDEHTLWLWRDADWRRWERDEPWDWDAHKRRAQAEELFRQQMQREVDRVMATKHQEEMNRKREEDEAREAKKESKFGRHRRFAHGGHEEAGAGMGGRQHSVHKRRRDFLGYYKALGINLEEAAVSAPITAESIKVHYKAAALKLHPDKHVHADEATQRRTAERFRRVQVAYEVLKDAEKRRAYDQGRLVHGGP